MNNLAQLIAEAREDPSLLSSIDIDNILDSLETTKTDFLEGQTLDSIAKNVIDALKTLSINRTLLTEYCGKLATYRYVDELHVLHKGKYVRWIRQDDPSKLQVGGIVVDIRFGDETAYIVCRLSSGRFLQYRFDRCMTFQKLTEDEQLILTLYEQ